MVKALVVDDSKVDRLMVGGLLEKDGEIEVSYASDGKEALAKIEESQPDLVITDLVMPELDGLELVGEIRKRFPLVPVILCTSKGSEQTAVEALQRGAASYVPKRLLASDLRETVDQVLSSSAQQRCRSEVMESMVRCDITFEIKNDRRLFSPLDQLPAGVPRQPGRARRGRANAHRRGARGSSGQRRRARQPRARLRAALLRPQGLRRAGRSAARLRALLRPAGLRRGAPVALGGAVRRPRRRIGLRSRHPARPARSREPAQGERARRPHHEDLHGRRSIQPEWATRSRWSSSALR